MSRTTPVLFLSMFFALSPMAALADAITTPAPAAAKADVKIKVEAKATEAKTAAEKPDAAPAAADATKPDENIGGLVEEMISAYNGKDWSILAGLSIMLLIWIIKRFIWTSLPVSVLPWLAAGLGVLAAVATALTLGQLWWKAILNGLTTGAAASGLWSLVGKHVFRGNK